ncbi:MAG: putative toxin-antitoxin system toxin component, PIN family [Candidatus Hydrogenedentes bacterium CG1_02_42_14]|nr:MAG: putative toxin-antitoxin system toxin component, PIN family [Candidatus Hydrogenedentes bacterium CG1_02_42_14]
MKAVLDTNVLISGLLWEGLPNEILALVKQGKIALHSSPEIIDELEAVLKRSKFSGRIAELEVSIDELIASILTIAEIYSVESTIEVIKEDPDDNMFLACAFYSGAEYIISGDKHLLNLGSYKRIEILSPREFLKKAASEGNKGR